MQNLADLNEQIDRMVRRLRSDRQGREERLKLALRLLADVEERVRSQRAALDRANVRIAALEAEREALVGRVKEIVGLYDNGLADTEALLGRIETLSTKVADETEATPKVDSSAILPVEQDSAVVQGPANTLFLRSGTSDSLPARERFKDHEAIRRLYNQYHGNGSRSGGVA